MYFRTPSPEVIWLDTSGKPIPADSDRFKISTADQETRLTVLKIDSDVAGKYVLVLKNELGEAQCEIPLEVSIPFVPGRPVLQKQGINSISLQWTAIPTFIDNKTVKYIIEMKKEGKDEWMKVTVCNQPSVTINELEAQQFYRFRVFASIGTIISNASEESESIFIGDEKLSKDEKEEVQIIKDELFISEKPSEFDALHELQPKIAEEEKRTRRERKKKLARTEIEFDSKLVDVTVNLGDSVELFVAVNSVHEPQVRWYRNEQVIDINDSRFIIKRENNRYGIKIISCEALDSGRWKVIAQNSDGQCESECQITVIKPADFTVPQFTKSLENIECEESSKVTLEVGVRANPKPQILWYFENIELYEKERYKLKADQVDGSYSFSIMPAIPKDSGVYRCIAKNIAGVAETYCNLTVNKRVRVTLDDKAPVFQMPLTDNEISEGCKMTLACAVTGTPNPSLQWFKNGKKLIDNDFVIKFERGLCTLTKDVVKLGDAGVYKCVAENMNGSSASECSVHIKPSGAINIKPYFKIPLTETSTISGSEVVLGCKVIGLPEPVITWYKDGQKLLFENRMLHCSYHNGNVRLNIMNVTANDSGEYLCEAVNAFGKDVSQCIVKVIDMASGSALERERESTSPTALEDETKAPVFTAPLHDVVFNEGSREILEVEVDAHPKPMIEWLLNGKLLQESSAIRSHFDGHLAILEISEVHSEHQGEVICRAVNKLGSAETRCSVLLDESKTFAEVPKIPEFCEKLRSIKVKNEGDTLTLKCKVIGQPEPEIQWLLNGKVIKTNAQKRIRTFDDGVSLLEILNITSESCGTYTALARNVYGDAHTSAEISLDGQVTTVMKKPFFVIEPRSYLVVEEDSVLSIVCGIDGKPEPEIYWFKEHSVISDDRVIIRKEGISHQIIISSVSSKDEGIYTIEAQNIGGKIRADIQVNVTPKEKLTVIEETGLLPPGKPFAAHLNKNSLLLQWEASNDKAKVEEYIIEQRRPDDQTWSVVGASRETQLLITGLQPNTEYVFRVAAKNKAGQGAYSSTSEVITTLPLGRKPTFESLPPTQIALNEEDIELLAEYSGDPIPSVKWYYNGIEISSKMNNITVVKLSDRSSKLVIRNPKPIIHTGIYSCHIVNETGEAISETRIIQQVEVSTREEVFEEIQVEHLVGAPRVVKPLSNETTTTGQEFILTCEIQSCPKGVISWFKNDERLAPVGRYEMHEQDDICKLICHKAQSSDTGTYRCVLTNSVGFAQSTCSLTVLPRILQMAPKFEVLLEDRTALSGKDVKMKCQVTGNPEPQITWMRDGVLISTNRHQKLEFSEDGWCSLTIFNCTAEDTGLYLCTACNVVGSKSSQCMLTIVDISGPDKHLVTAEIKEALYCKPKFTRAPSAVVETVEGSMVKLTSRAIGQPTPIVKWFKDGKEITKVNRAYEVRLTGEGESVLVIPCVVAKTAGIFKCVAENTEGSENVETCLIVHALLHKQPDKEAPNFVVDLVDTGVAIGHPVTLKCVVKGIPEPELKWIFINDAQQTSLLRTTTNSLWTECRRGETCEMKTENVMKAQQGTYQCFASNEYGKALTQCYLLVGEPSDQPAGPPRFLKCIRDIWTPLGGEVEFEVEVSGHPLPELTWYHADEKVIEDKNIQISFITPTRCQLKISNLSLLHLGTYSVEASNIHGIVRTIASLNVGKERTQVEPPKFYEEFEKKLIAVAPRTSETNELDALATDKGQLSASYQVKSSRSDIKRRGAAPAFVIGLQDLELHEGDAAALAGTVARKRRHHIHGKSSKKRATQIVAIPDIDGETSNVSLEPPVFTTTLEEIRALIAERNKNVCRPKFMVKPKAKKSLAEYKSLRLKTAISANPIPTVRWDKAGVVLETGNKYSIYNDGDFYYLEVHHVSKIDEGFYNCSASNSEGIVTCTAEIVVTPSDGTKELRKVPVAPSFIEVLPGKLKAVAGEAVSVECSVSGYPIPAIKWLRNGAEFLPQHDHCIISYDGETTTLSFLNIATSDIGKYICVASNQQGQAKTAMQLDVELRMLPKIGGTPPKFLSDKQPKEIMVMDGDEVLLHAELLQGSEPLSVRWIRNKMEIQNSNGFAYSRKEGSCLLTIADAFPEDSGIYICEASNEFGTDEYNINLIVTERRKKSVYENQPIIENAPTSISVEPGNDLELIVKVSGHPEPAVIWTKNLSPITSGAKYQMFNDKESFTLKISNCTDEDAGRYEIQAVNNSGTATAVITVIVTEVVNQDAVLPKFTKLPISVQSTIGQKASLSCSFKGLKPTVTWFHGNEKLISGRNGIEISSTATSSTLSILRLVEEHFGEYLCTVRNDYGEDLAKAVILLEGSFLFLCVLN